VGGSLTRQKPEKANSRLGLGRGIASSLLTSYKVWGAYKLHMAPQQRPRQ